MQGNVVVINYFIVSAMPTKKKVETPGQYTNQAWIVKNVRPFYEFMTQMGLSTKTVAEAIGITPTGVRRWLQVDDMMVSNLYKVADAYGYDIKIKLVPLKKENTEDSGIEIQMGNRPTKRLGFIDVAMKQSRVPRSELAARLGITPAGMRFWMHNDDTFMSWIYKVAEALDMKVAITFSPKEQKQN